MTRKLTTEELRKAIDHLSKQYNRPWILQQEFTSYLKAKGYTDEEIDEIWFQAFRKGLVIATGTLVGNRRELMIYKPSEEEEEWGCMANQ